MCCLLCADINDVLCDRQGLCSQCRVFLGDCGKYPTISYNEGRDVTDIPMASLHVSHRLLADDDESQEETGYLESVLSNEVRECRTEHTTWSTTSSASTSAENSSLSDSNKKKDRDSSHSEDSIYSENDGAILLSEENEIRRNSPLPTKEAKKRYRENTTKLISRKLLHRPG